MSETDLWNQPIGSHKSKTIVPRGHAGPPGSGPAGETCRTCKHLTRREYSKTYLKCALMRHKWSGGTATDIRAKDAACSRWEESK